MFLPASVGMELKLLIGNQVLIKPNLPTVVIPPVARPTVITPVVQPSVIVIPVVVTLMVDKNEPSEENSIKEVPKEVITVKDDEKDDVGGDNMKNVEDAVKILHGTPTKLYCKCGKTFSTQGAFTKHIINVHQCDTPKHECNICGRMFKKKESMQKHRISKHDNRMIYRCTICVITFSTKENMDRHDRRKHHE